MEFIRRNSDYALRSLNYMASFPLGKRFTVNLIAQKQDVPVAFLRKIFQRLSEGKILESQRGVKGGFYLLKKPSQIKLRKILEAVQGRISLSECLFEDNICHLSKICKIKPGLSHIQNKLIHLLEKYTLDDFL